jgi:hypothetical protein
MHHMIDIATDDGEVTIREDEISSLTEEELRALRISRAELQRVFAEGVKLTRDISPGDHVRPCASEDLQGEWHVVLVRDAEFSDPRLRRPIAGQG